MFGQNNEVHPTISSLRTIPLWIGGIAATYILQLLLPIVLGVITNDNTLRSIGAVAGIFIIIGISIIYPLSILISAIQEPIQTAPFQEMMINIVVVLFGIIFLFIGSFLFTAGASLFTTTFELTIYWIGTIISFGGSIFLVPIYRIIKARGSA